MRRAYGIEVFSFDETGEEIEEKLYGFPARVFAHEMDHMRGDHLLTWSVSAGHVSICSTEHPDDHFHFLESAEHWQAQLAEAAQEFPELMDPQSSHLETEVDEEGREWQKSPRKKDIYEELDRNRPQYSHTEAMQMDLLKSERKDIKIKLSKGRKPKPDN